MDIKEKIGNRIKELRNLKKISQLQLSNLANLDRTYITSVENGKRNVSIVNIEMKKTTKREGEIIQQLTGAQCFVTYCRKIGQAPAFWNQRDFLKGYQERFVSIRHTNTSINKRPTRAGPKDGVHDRPNRMLKISAPRRLFWRRLI